MSPSRRGAAPNAVRTAISPRRAVAPSARRMIAFKAPTEAVAQTSAARMPRRRFKPSDWRSAGQAARATFGQEVYDLNVQQYCAAGLNFGSYIGNSPIVAETAETPPPYSMAEFTPSTVPGCRTPHFFFSDGRSLYDALGADYPLLRRRPDLDVTPLLSAAAECGLPLQLLDIPGAEAQYQALLTISRPDQHVAWRGNSLPGDMDALLSMLNGNAGASR